ncbi:hypothetical protein [Arabidopsis thaliana]|uniref:Uncharacterized protein AT4g21950 n=3 Tax=Arabidopsis TaxID=3701 RepID=O49718_ARATH|nr:hypothetical protein ISN45_At04g023010 [Arabidopsis thaliana x Arabidopsis arenosa]KAG7621347.1 hypothetical protein ISN44_As04g022520 [Arabidopsis suecica]CAA17162.1 hypothetical protein [Arabidopsis thaliana]CAB79150.1 hypothetical protein [Arabidopsis thaliana]
MSYDPVEEYSIKEKINSELMDLGCRGDVSMHAYGNKDTFSDDTKR